MERCRCSGQRPRSRRPRAAAAHNHSPYDYILSDPNAYEVLRHGFRVNETGNFKLDCTLHLESYTSGERYNIALQFAKKPNGSNVWSRVGVPVMTGYINRHNSGVAMNQSKSISSILNLNVGDEVALFTAGFGRLSLVNNRCFALVKQSSFSIHSM